MAGFERVARILGSLLVELSPVYEGQSKSSWKCIAL